MKHFWRIIFVWLVMSSTISGMIHAQSIEEIFNKFIKRYHNYQNTTFPYYIFVPTPYNPQIHYPLVLCLHGVGESGDNPAAVEKNSMATVWARDSNQARWPCFILVPQCPTGESWGNTNMILAVNDILDSILLSSSIDTNRLYITGLSMGGYGTWSMIIQFPNKFAAAIPMSGGGDSSQAALIKRIPIWDFHGAKDPTVNVNYSREMITALENAGDTVVYTNCHNNDCSGLSDSVIADKIKNGAKLLYTEYQYGNHTIWDQAYNYIYLLPWTFSQSKTQTAASIGQENFNILPKEPSLSQNFPNPFNPSTNIAFTISTTSYVLLKVFDLIGREVGTIFCGELAAGTYTQQWNAKYLPSGVYFYRLNVVPLTQHNLISTNSRGGQIGMFTKARKFILLK